MKARFIDFDKTMRNKNGARNFFIYATCGRHGVMYTWHRMK